MNYRHAYHAGNPADCVKHALLVALLRVMKRKPAPLFVLDTHAGIGGYDLSGPEAAKTGEFQSGIGRLRAAAPPALHDYLALAADPSHYPGSPALARALLGPADRLALCELQAADAAALKRRFHRDAQVQVHHRDGYEALGALLPPAERRALVLIDPPYEREDEFATIAASLDIARKKFPSGVFAVWYPVKHRPPVREFFADLAARQIPDMIACEALFRPPLDPTRLNGCGLLIVNPAYRFADEAAPILQALRNTLCEPAGSAGMIRLTDE